ncbi:MAG: transporter substrate-binding domain-containing protein [Reinekea sp.]
MKKFLVTFLLTATAIFSFSARADDSKVIVAAADAWPPFVDPAAPGNGLSLEIITAAFKTHINGFAYDEEFMGSSEFERSGVPDFQKNIKKLLIKRIDITLEDRIVAKHILTQEDPAALSQIRFSEKSLSHEELYIAAGYKNPRHEEIISAFNKGLEIIKADGRLDKILNNQSLDN